MQMNRRWSIQCLAAMFAGCCTAVVPLRSRNTAHASNHFRQGFEAEFPSMGSKINLRWYDSRSNSTQLVLSAATAVADKWVNILSDYEPNSEAMMACQQADSGNWVQVSEDLWNVILECNQWNRWSNGAFDAALGATTRLRRQRKPATPQQWEHAQASSGWHLLATDPSKRSIRTTRPGVRLDFGAIGKGLVVDKISEKLLQMGIDQFNINASGNMRMGKAPDNTQGWPVSIDIPVTDPNHESLEFMRMRLSHRGVATSGDRWQRFPDPIEPKIGATDTKKSSHIVDPKTLRGVSGHHSVTVIADNAMDADAIATATSVRTQNDLAGWLQTLNRLKPGVQVLILSKDEETQAIRSRFVVG